MKIGSKKMKQQDRSTSYALQRRCILNAKSDFYVLEAYKSLRTNIRFFLSGDDCKKFCITSGMAGEGKSITALNLAISFAETGQRVVLIDADLRRPSMARLLIEKVSPGLSNVLAGLCSADDAIRKTVYPNLDIIFSGEVPPNPSELLSNNRMEKLIDTLSRRYDYILIDTPPVGIVSDACVVANYLDGVLFLVRQNESEKEVVAQCVKQLEFAGAKVMGFVLNGSDQVGGKRYKEKRYRYRYRYGYRYGYRYNSVYAEPSGKDK